MTLAIAILFACVPLAGLAADAESDRISTLCPHLDVAMLSMKQKFAHPLPPITSVTRPALQRELLLRAKQDQEVRVAPDGQALDYENPDVLAHMQQVDDANLTRLKQIIRQDGFPTPRMIGYDGVHAVWLLIQHASDPKFQAQMLPLIEKHARAGELDLGAYAMLRRASVGLVPIADYRCLLKAIYAPRP
jgi:hypothetical protein